MGIHFFSKNHRHHINNISYYYTFPVLAPSSNTRPALLSLLFHVLQQFMKICVTDSLTVASLCYRKDPYMLPAIPEEQTSEISDDYIKNFLEDAAAYCAAASERAAASLYAAEGYGTKNTDSKDVLPDLSRTEHSFSLDSKSLAVASSIKSRVTAAANSSLAGRLIKRTKQSVSNSSPVKELIELLATLGR